MYWLFYINWYVEDIIPREYVIHKSSPLEYYCFSVIFEFYYLDHFEFNYVMKMIYILTVIVDHSRPVYGYI